MARRSVSPPPAARGDAPEVELYASLNDIVPLVNEEKKSKKEELKRLVVLGRTGTGKSFLLNIMSGYTCFLHRRVRKWMFNDAEVDGPCFEEGKGKSITREVVCARVGWRGHPTEKLIVVDVPGTDDTFLALEEGSAERARFQSGRATDFCVKAKALERVHAFVVLVEGQNLRCKDAAEILKTLKKSFAGTVDDDEIWQHVIIGISRCNPGERLWDETTGEETTQVRTFINQALKRRKNAALKVVKLGGLDTPAAREEGLDAAGELDKVWKFVEHAPGVSTTGLITIESEEEILHRLRLEADAPKVVASLGFVAMALWLRNLLTIGRMGQFLLLNLEELWIVDELLLVGLALYLLDLQPARVFKSVRYVASPLVRMMLFMPKAP